MRIDELRKENRELRKKIHKLGLKVKKQQKVIKKSIQIEEHEEIINRIGNDFKDQMKELLLSYNSIKIAVVLDNFDFHNSDSTMKKEYRAMRKHLDILD